MYCDISCVILCGGQSKRMGEDKSLLHFKNTTLWQYQYDKYSKIFKNVYLSSKTNKFDSIDDDKITFDNDNNIFAPLIALDSIFKTIDTQKVFIVSVDTPLIRLDTIDKLISYSKDYDITVAKTDTKIHNLCGVFDTKIKSKLQNMLDDENYKINFLIKNSNYYEVYFDDEMQFINTNTKDEYMTFIGPDVVKPPKQQLECIVNADAWFIPYYAQNNKIIINKLTR